MISAFVIRIPRLISLFLFVYAYDEDEKISPAINFLFCLNILTSLEDHFFEFINSFLNDIGKYKQYIYPYAVLDIASYPF